MTGRFGKRQRNRGDAEGHFFRYPLAPCPKVTVICDTMHVSSGCIHVSEHDPVNQRILRTETLAAPASVLLDLNDGWMPRFPLVAFTGIRHGFLDNADRERLWRRFGVPVFEQLVDDQGRVFATECEAHAGLHIRESAGHTLVDGELFVDGRPSGIAASDSAGLCGCGRIGPRLLEVGPAMRLLASVS